MPLTGSCTRSWSRLIVAGHAIDGAQGEADRADDAGQPTSVISS